ncbi:MAG: peptidoglycan DD-metalloendopeptidase family protein [Candidatus Neomarinimicrobiota bacterium]|nr:peptidoglycan DD-metalloendopeptidase family protein [Candidatus Neomarinimicrobiota bacterium]
MNKHKLILLVFFLFSIGFLFAQEKNFEEEIEHTEKQIQLLQASIKKNNEEIQKVTSQEKTTGQLLLITRKNIKDSRNLITAYDKKLNLYSLQLTNLQNAVDKNNKEIVTIKDNYKERSINIYKKKNTKMNSSIFTANSLSQAVYRIKYYNILSNINQEMLDKLKTTQFYNEKKKIEIKQLLNNVNGDKKSKENELNSLDKKKKYQEELLIKLQKEKQSIQTEITKQNTQINALEQLRKTILEQKKQYDIEQLDQLKKIKSNIKEFKGKLIWPVDGKIVKGFGPQWNSKLNTTLHNPGVDIAANPTASVRSIFDGLVTTITFIAGYGTTVIVDHDDGYFTVFTHLDNLLVTKNMLVKEGQKIGFISKESQVVHFEIWGNNQTLNPKEWLKDGYR